MKIKELKAVSSYFLSTLPLFWGYKKEAVPCEKRYCLM